MCCMSAVWSVYEFVGILQPWQWFAYMNNKPLLSILGFYFFSLELNGMTGEWNRKSECRKTPYAGQCDRRRKTQNRSNQWQNKKFSNWIIIMMSNEQWAMSCALCTLTFDTLLVRRGNLPNRIDTMWSLWSSGVWTLDYVTNWAIYRNPIYHLGQWIPALVTTQNNKTISQFSYASLLKKTRENKTRAYECAWKRVESSLWKWRWCPT